MPLQAVKRIGEPINSANRIHFVFVVGIDVNTFTAHDYIDNVCVWVRTLICFARAYTAFVSTCCTNMLRHKIGMPPAPPPLFSHYCDYSRRQTAPDYIFCFSTFTVDITIKSASRHALVLCSFMISS